MDLMTAFHVVEGEGGVLASINRMRQHFFVEDVALVLNLNRSRQRDEEESA